MGWNLLVPRNQEHITELLLLQVILHFAEGLLRMVRGLEILVRAIGAHPKRAAGGGQPARDRGSDQYSVINADNIDFCSKSSAGIFRIIKVPQSQSYCAFFQLFLFGIWKFSFINLHINCALLELCVVGGAPDLSPSLSSEWMHCLHSTGVTNAAS